MAKRRRKINRDAVRRMASDQSRGGGVSYLQVPDGMEFFRPSKKGSYTIDILPYELKDKRNPACKKFKLGPGDIWYERTFYVHFGVGPDNGMVVCPARTANKPCPVCELIRELRSRGEDEQADALRVKERQLFPVIDIASKDQDIQLWNISSFLFGQKLANEINNSDEDEELDGFSDPVDGYSLKILFEEKSIGGGSPFLDCASIRFKPRKNPYDEDVIDEVPNLDDMVILQDYKDIYSLLHGEEYDGDDDDEDAVRPRRGKSKKAEPEPEPDDDDDEDDDIPEYGVSAEDEDQIPFDPDEDEDEDEEEPPIKRRGKRVPEPDDGVDEDDEDEPPIRRRRKRRSTV